MREHTITLRILSSKLSPEQVSRKIGLKPTLQRVAGSATGKPSPHVWEYEVEHRAQPSDFPGRLTELLDAISQSEDRIVSIQEDADVVLWGACFTDDPEVTLQISPKSMARLAALGIEAHLSVYASSSD